ncbi:MAG: cysteine-rich small domain-containing protein [Clostridiales bacterium]|nr:cysteine-rich small domain-containing protein [Clostridiales bacterium]
MEVDEKFNAYSFFQNKACEYFPCHDTKWPEEFNCLFCFCPLYMLDEKCGGGFSYTKNMVKDCSQCITPHKKDSYVFIISKFEIIKKIMEANRGKK